ncbi:MAG: hypothetical protein WBO46_09020 [Caldilineaceae bacterium]
MDSTIPLVIHATHEAGVKVGGIGAVLDGLLGADVYNQRVARSVLVGPLSGWDSVQMERLNSPRNRLTIRYSSLHGIFDNVEPALRDALQAVEQTYRVAVLYGTRGFGAYEHEVLLVDASNPDREAVNAFRYYVWQHYGIDSSRYAHADEMNLYFSIAQPLFASLKAIGADTGLSQNERFIIAHEWLGMPVVFASQMNEPGQWRTIFYAHEMATARLLVETHGGHDTRFYNALFRAQAWGQSLDDVFGNHDFFFKHAIIRQATRCDNIFAVGDLVVPELRFLGGEFAHKNIDLVYNGVTVHPITLAEKLTSRRLLQEYCQNLLGYRPDYIFTHVTRMVLSKGMWRDIRVMEHLDRMLREVNKTAVLFVLSTSQPAGRRSEWVHAWESQYGWPVGHRADNGDLIDAETGFFFDGVEPFNQRARDSRIVLINQFGWDRQSCGQRMPAAMSFMDLRRGSDVEFGQSVYEPFGIAQVEPLNFGAISCVSNVCGCVGFVNQVAEKIASREGAHFDPSDNPNLMVADYVSLPDSYPIHSPQDALSIGQPTRDWIEGMNSGDTAWRIFRRLPVDETGIARLMESGEALAQGMSWDVVVQDYLLPGLEKARGEG